MKGKIRFRFDAISIAAIVALACGLVIFAFGLRQAVSLSPRFSFEHSYFSELGQSDQASAPFFNHSLRVLSLCAGLFFANFLRLEAGRWLGVAGVVSSAGLLGVSLTPMDLYVNSHNASLVLWLLGLMAMIILQFACYFRDAAFWAAAVSLILGFLIVNYAVSGSKRQAAYAQKLVVAGAVVWLIGVCWHLLRNTFAVFKERVARFGLDDSSQAYIKKIEAHGLYGPNGRRRDPPSR